MVGLGYNNTYQKDFITATNMATSLETGDHGEVYVACSSVSVHWRDLGARLGVLVYVLDGIDTDNSGKVKKCMSAMLDVWLRRPLGEVRDGVTPTWKSLCVALSHIDRPLAEVISVEHGCNYITPAVSEVASYSGVPPVFLPQSCGCGKCTIKGWMSGRMCQNPYLERRPKLLLVNAAHPIASDLVKFEEDYDRQARLCSETSYLDSMFTSICLDTWSHLKIVTNNQTTSVSDMAFKLGTWLKKALPMITCIQQLQSHFHMLNISWFNFGPLLFLVEQFLSSYSDMLAMWNNYLAIFREYCSSRNLKDYTSIFFEVKEHNIFLLEIDECYENFTLSDIRALRDSLSIALNCSSVCLHLVTVRPGSLVVYFHYCYTDYLLVFQSLGTEQLQMIAEIKLWRILSLVDLHDRFRYDKIQSLAKMVYKGSTPSGMALPTKDEVDDVCSGPPNDRKTTGYTGEVEIWRKQSHIKDMELAKMQDEYAVSQRSLWAMEGEVQELKRKLHSQEVDSLGQKDEVEIWRKRSQLKDMELAKMRYEFAVTQSSLQAMKEEIQELKRELHSQEVDSLGQKVKSHEQKNEDVEDEEEDPKKKLMEEDQAHLEAEKVLELMKPIAKASFHEHVLQLHEDADKGYENEYKSIPMSTESAIDSAKEESNKPKNRFADIFPYDYTRVKLREVEGVPGSDYINASYVDGYNLKDCYVCAQGPLPTTVSDFWRMIWEKRLTNIVMLTRLIEGGKKKCEQYWPETVGETVDMQGGLHVTMTSRVPFSDYTIHSLKVSKPEDKDATPLEITHYHFTAWPDHGVPQFATSLISFINRVQKGHDKTRGIPLVVHCSAGVGRTGTFVALDSMMDRLQVQDSLNMYEFLRQMRSKRMYMIPTLAQYVFVHDALDEYITCGETHISASNLKVRVSKMHKNIPSKGISGFQEQYQLLEQVCYVPNESTYSDAKKPCNLPKNRYQDIVPLNLNRPRLCPDGFEGSDYINASFVDGYKQRNAYLVTQGPLKNTTDDFWRLIVEFKSRNIVMLCNTVEEGEEKCYMYWPTKEGEPVEYSKHKVTLQSETPSGDYIIRKFLIQNEKSAAKAEREGVTVIQFHYTVWSEHGIPSGTGQIIEMIDILTRSQMNTGNKPITVVCNDGVGRSGAFLCIHSQLEKIKTEGEIDVFKYLKSARTKRIGLVSELNHYVFIHQVLADYVESFDPYANFKD